MHELRGHCTVDTTADSTNNATLFTTDLSNTLNFFANERFLINDVNYHFSIL